LIAAPDLHPVKRLEPKQSADASAAVGQLVLAVESLERRHVVVVEALAVVAVKGATSG